MFWLKYSTRYFARLFWSISSDTTSRYVSPSPHTLRNVATTILLKIFPIFFLQNLIQAHISCKIRKQISYQNTDHYLIQIQIPDTTSIYLSWYPSFLSSHYQSPFKNIILTHTIYGWNFSGRTTHENYVIFSGGFCHFFWQLGDLECQEIRHVLEIY